MNIKRTCPICGEDFTEHNTADDRLGTLGSIYIDGVSYIVPMQVVSAYHTLREAQRWIPVGERLPDGEKLVLVVCQNLYNDGYPMNELHISIALFCGEWKEFNGFAQGIKVISWRPLPPAPEVEG